MNKFEYKNLTPFKWFVLENFPFIEADFDALTEWQLFCKLGKEMNKIINSENTLGTQMENVTNAFIELYNSFENLTNYVNNYFNNLDVQEEINTKLNEMAENGTLLQILNQYDYALNIKSFGCKDDGETDNTENLITAFNYCYTNNRTLYVPKGTFLFSTPIAITNLPNIKMDGTLKYNGNSNDYALTLGDNENEQNNLNLEFMLSCEKSTTNKGLKLININNSNIKLKYIYGFGTGVTLNGNNKGFSYNKIDCYNIYNNNIGLEIQPTGTGWVNENLFLNGNFKYSNQLDKTGTIGIKMSGGDDNYTNNNYFLKPNFEQLDKCVVLTRCANNTFKQCRCEKVNITLSTDNLSRINEFEIGYGNIVYDINNQTNILRTQAMKPLLTPTKVYDINYNDNTSFETYNDVLDMKTNNYCVMHSGGSTSKSLSYNDNFLLSDGYLKQLVTRKAIGIFIKTDTIKDFYARKQTLFNEPGRWFLRCYDENKEVITDLGENFNETSETLTKYNDINNGYRTTADLNHDIFIHIPDNVKYIFFGLTRVGKPYSIKSMEIYANKEFQYADDIENL